MTTTHLALLRGINVGGNNILPLKDLIALFDGAGCRNVRSYIQSGNVVFTAGESGVETLPKLISERIEDAFGYRIPVVVFSLAELEEAIAANPFLAAGVEQKNLHVYFLQAVPSDKAVAILDPRRSPPDTFVVTGRRIYLNLPHGMARTKLTNAYFDSLLKTVSTARNWKTVLQLAESMKG